MKLAGDYLFDATVAEVWAALFDPVILAAVLPGCEKLDRVGDQYVGEIKVKVGPVTGKFAGKVDLLDIDEPRRYRMVIDGRGSAGFVNANATVALAAEGERTRMTYDADAQVGGKLAGVGQRLVEASTRAIVAQALEGLHTNVKLRAEAYRKAEAEAKKEPAPKPEPEPVAEPGSEPEPESEPESEPEPGSEPEPESGSEPGPGSGSGSEPEPVPVAAKPVAAKPVAFTPVKVTQGDMAASVAKEVARDFFSRTTLAVIIALQFAVILWLLLR